MSSVAQDWAWTRPVDGPRLLVLLALAKKVRPKTEEATPSMPELAHLTGMSETTVRGHIQALARDGIIRHEESSGGRRQRSRYFLTGCLTPKVLWGSKPVKTPREQTPRKPETPQISAKNPPATGPVVLRTDCEQDGGSTPAAAASAAEQAELFEAQRQPPAKTGRALAIVQRKELAEINAGHAAAAWFEGYAESHDAQPTARQRGQVGRECRLLLEAGNDPERVLQAARSAGRRGMATVEREHNTLARRSTAPAPAAPPARQSTTDQRVAAGMDLARRLAEQERSAG